MVVIPVEESAERLPVPPVVGGVAVQKQAPRRGPQGGDELLGHDLVQANRLIPADALLEPAPGRSASQGLVAASRGLQHRVRTQRMGGVQGLVAQRQPMNALAAQRQGRLRATSRAARVVHRARRALGQSQEPVGRAQQQCASGGGEAPPAKDASTKRPLPRGKRMEAR